MPRGVSVEGRPLGVGRLVVATCGVASCARAPCGTRALWRSAAFGIGRRETQSLDSIPKLNAARKKPKDDPALLERIRKVPLGLRPHSRVPPYPSAVDRCMN